MDEQPDVQPLVWGVICGGALAAVTVLTLLVTAHFTGRGLLLVFAVPFVMLGVVGIALALRRDAARQPADPGAGEQPGGGD